MSAVFGVTSPVAPFQAGIDVARALQPSLLHIVPTTRERVMPDPAAVLAPSASSIGLGPSKPPIPIPLTGAPMGSPTGAQVGTSGAHPLGLPEGRPGDFADHLAIATGHAQAIAPVPTSGQAPPATPQAVFPSAQTGFSVAVEAERRGTEGIERVGDTPFWPMAMPANGIEVTPDERANAAGTMSDLTGDDDDPSPEADGSRAWDPGNLAPLMDVTPPPMPDPSAAAGAILAGTLAVPTEVVSTATGSDISAGSATVDPSRTASAPFGVTPSGVIPSGVIPSGAESSGQASPNRSSGSEAANAPSARGFEAPGAADPTSRATGSEPSNAPPIEHDAAAIPEGAIPAGAIPAGAIPEGTIPEGAIPEGAITTEPDTDNPTANPPREPGSADAHAVRRAASESNPASAQAAQADPRAGDPAARRAALGEARDATEAPRTQTEPTNQAMAPTPAPDGPDRSAPPSTVASDTRATATPTDQIATRVAPVLVRLDPTASGGQRLTIRLDPEELGQVEVRIERPEPLTARVHILVERPETLALLRRDQAALERALDEAGVGTRSRDVVFDLADPATVQASTGTESRQDPSSRQDSPRAGAETFASLADQRGDRRSGQGEGRDRTAQPDMARVGLDTLSGPPGTAAADRGAWRRPGLNITA